LTKGSAVGGVFIPILNPLELWQASVLFSLAFLVEIFWSRDRCTKEVMKQIRWTFIALWFLWINQVAVRIAWWYGETSPHSFWEALQTGYCQALISILWGVTGAGAVLCGRKMRRRAFWKAGAGLLAIDMAKLLLIDLNRVATLTRILAFLVLGALFFLIGWAAPLPPQQEEEEEDGGAMTRNG
jgi:uncharacterized membrane protein